MRLIAIVVLFLTSIGSAAEFRELTTEAGSHIKIDIETHRVYVQIHSQTPLQQSQPDQPAVNPDYWVSSNREVFVNPEFNHFIQVEPPSSINVPPTIPPAQNLGSLGVPLPEPGAPAISSVPPSTTEVMLRSTSPGTIPRGDYAPTAPISQGQALILTQAVNDLFGPGIPVRDYSSMESAAHQNAELAARLRREAEALRSARPIPYQLPTYQPSEDQLKRYRDHRILDVPSIPDPTESDLPYHFQYQGPQREELVRLYKHLYKVTPETEKRRNARELGLISVEEADASFNSGNTESGRFFTDLAEGFLDLAIGIDPVTGIARSTYELIAGRNFITGARLSNWEYGFAALNVLTIGGEGLAASALKGLSRVVSRGSKFVRISQLTADGIEVAERALESATATWKSIEPLLHTIKGNIEKTVDGTFRLKNGMHTETGFGHFLRMSENSGKTFAVIEVEQFNTENITSSIFRQTLRNGVTRLQLPKEAWINSKSYRKAIAYSDSGTITGAKTLFPQSFSPADIAQAVEVVLRQNPESSSTALNGTFKNIRVRVLRNPETGVVKSVFPTWIQE